VLRVRLSRAHRHGFPCSRQFGWFATSRPVDLFVTWRPSSV